MRRLDIEHVGIEGMCAQSLGQPEKFGIDFARKLEPRGGERRKHSEQLNVSFAETSEVFRDVFGRYRHGDVSLDRNKNFPVRNDLAGCSLLWSNANCSVQLYLGDVYDVAPLLRVRLDEGGELLGRADHRLKHVGSEEFLSKFRVLKHQPHVSIDLGDDVARRVAWGKQPEPGHGLEAREPSLGSGQIG